MQLEQQCALVARGRQLDVFCVHNEFDLVFYNTKYILSRVKQTIFKESLLFLANRHHTTGFGPQN